MKKLICTVLTAIMIWTMGVPAVVQAETTPLETLAAMETMLYGYATKDGSMVTRLESLETDLFGQPQRGALLVRIERVRSYLDVGGLDGNPLRLKLAALEWMMYQKTSMDKPLFDRVKDLENGVYGAVQSGPLQARITELTGIIWGAKDVATKSTLIPKETLVKVRLLETVNSGENKANDTVPYEVVKDVIVDNKLIIPAGTKGTATVTSVTAAGRLGRDGKLEVEFGRVVALDGTKLDLNISERSAEENKSLHMAAGASMLGVILLAGNPIGLAGAFLVKGKDVSIEKDVEFFIEVEKSVNVNGLVISAD